jgi:hypothetical protein
VAARAGSGQTGHVLDQDRAGGGTCWISKSFGLKMHTRSQRYVFTDKLAGGERQAPYHILPVTYSCCVRALNAIPGMNNIIPWFFLCADVLFCALCVMGVPLSCHDIYLGPVFCLCVRARVRCIRACVCVLGRGNCNMCQREGVLKRSPFRTRSRSRVWCLKCLHSICPRMHIANHN